jgi:nucleoside-diphosphate-sugar epimerase
MILLLGSHGYVGGAIARELSTRGFEYLIHQARYPLNEQDFIRFLLSNKISRIINCAGFVGLPNVDSCEDADNKIPCLYANALLPAQILGICNKHNIRFNHVSSGCIYTDAACDRALDPTIVFQEKHAPNFDFNSNKASWYSCTKALGETLLLNDNASAGCNIFRLRIPFDGIINDRNYLTKLCKYPVLLNATNSLSNLNEFAHAVVEISLLNNYGIQIYNVTQPGYIKTDEIVEMLQKKNLVKDKQWFKSIEDFNRVVKAPRSNCTLDSTKILREGIHLTPVHDSLMQAIDEYKFNSQL